MAIHNLWCIKVHSKHSTVLLLCLLQNLIHQRLCSVLSWHHVGLFQMANYVYYEIECIKHYMDFTQMHWKTASLTAFTIHLKSSWTSKISLRPGRKMSSFQTVRILKICRTSRQEVMSGRALIFTRQDFVKTKLWALSSGAAESDRPSDHVAEPT